MAALAVSAGEVWMDIRAQIREFITDNFMMGQETDLLPDSGSLLEMGVLDSIGVLELVAYIEETYGVAIADNELVPDNLASVDRLVACIERKVA